MTFASLPPDTTEPRKHFEESRHRNWCVARKHPGTTFNPLLNRTWCACGEFVVDGDTASHDLCCGDLEPVAAGVAAAISAALAPDAEASQLELFGGAA